MNVLMARHPAQAMVADLDQRIAGLALQRTHLLEQTDGAVPPTVITHSLPQLPAMQAPGAVTLPAPPADQLNAQAQEAFRRSLTYELERKITRDERRLREESATKLQEQCIQLAQKADAERRAITQQFRLPLVRGELRMQMAGEQVKHAQRQLYEATRKRTDISARKDAAAPAEAQRALLIHEAARAQLQRAEAHAQSIAHQYDEDQAAYRAALSAVDTTYADATRLAREQQATLIATQIQQMREQMRDELEHSVAAREAQFDADAQQRNPSGSLPPMQYAAMPDMLSVETSSLPESFQMANADARRHRQSALQHIDQTLASLRQQRGDMLACIEQDTRAAAATVAWQHGYQLTGAGKDITVQVRQWLRDYWPSIRDGHPVSPRGDHAP